MCYEFSWFQKARLKEMTARETNAEKREKADAKHAPATVPSRQPEPAAAHASETEKIPA